MHGDRMNNQEADQIQRSKGADEDQKQRPQVALLYESADGQCDALTNDRVVFHDISSKVKPPKFEFCTFGSLGNGKLGKNSLGELLVIPLL